MLILQGSIERDSRLLQAGDAAHFCLARLEAAGSDDHLGSDGPVDGGAQAQTVVTSSSRAGQRGPLDAVRSAVQLQTAESRCGR